MEFITVLMNASFQHALTLCTPVPNPSRCWLMGCEMHLSSGTCMAGHRLVSVSEDIALEPSALLFPSVLLGLRTHGPALSLGFPHLQPWPPAALGACVLDAHRPPPGFSLLSGGTFPVAP